MSKFHILIYYLYLFTNSQNLPSFIIYHVIHVESWNDDVTKTKFVKL